MISQRLGIKTQFLGLLLGGLLSLSACGQVITPQPSPTPTRAGDPTSTPSGSAVYSATSVPVISSRDVATPTITPTPIVHIVQKGDTLLGIALDFGVSVEALQTANGIDNPQFLQVGQQLVIPVGDVSGRSSPSLLLPTPTPQPIRVQGAAFYETAVGSLLGLGEIANTTPLTLTNVQVAVTLLDASGQPLLETDTFASMDIIYPDVRTPFSVLFSNPPTEWESYQVTVLRGQEAGVLATGFVPISVLEAEGNTSGPQFEVSGTVRNASADQAARTVDLFVTTYDAQGNVTGYRRAPLSTEEGLAPGEEAAFSLTLSTHGDSPVDFSVTALGRAADGMNPGG